MYAQTFRWATQLEGIGNDEGHSVAVDSSGNVYTTGFFSATADFDPGPGTFNLTSAGGTDVFISKLNNAGNFVWARQLGGTSVDQGLSITVDNSGNVYTTGFFSVTADFDPGPGAFTFTSGGLRDIFISKLDSTGNFVWARQFGPTTPPPTPTPTPPVGAPPVVNGPPKGVCGTTLSVNAGGALNFTVLAEDLDLGQIVILTTFGLPVGATTTPSLPSVTPSKPPSAGSPRWLKQAPIP